MANFIDMDSFWRDREIYPNENNYEVKPSQVDTWYKSPRSVRAFPQNPNIQPLEFATTVNIRYLTIPYSETVAEFPRIYVNFHSKRYTDINLINAIDGRQPTAKFICIPERIQNDINGNPIWIHYKCLMEQTMRFQRGEPVVFQITSRDGSILPQLDTDVPLSPDPTKQTLCTFEITPLIRDGDYSDNVLTGTNTT